MRPIDRQSKRRGRRHIRWRLDAKKAPDDQIRQLVVFRAADAMNKEIAEDQAGIHGRDECSRTYADVLAHEDRPVFARVMQGERDSRRHAICYFKATAGLPEEKGLALRILKRGQPQWHFEPWPLAGEFWHRMRGATNVVGNAIFLQRPVINVMKFAGSNE